MELRKIENIVATWAAAKPEIGKVFLYGSRVKKTHRQNSDIDIAIEFDQNVISSTDSLDGMAT